MTIKTIEKEKLNVSFAYLTYDKVNSEPAYDTLLVSVTTKDGKKEDWKLVSDSRDIKKLEELVKERKVKKYEVTRERMLVPESVHVSFASIVKKRVELDGFNKGFIYVLKEGIEVGTSSEEEK